MLNIVAVHQVEYHNVLVALKIVHAPEAIPPK